MRGVVGMARARDPNSGNSQFFIMYAAAPNLDRGYTVIGKVTSGMEVVETSQQGPGLRQRPRAKPGPHRFDVDRPMR